MTSGYSGGTLPPKLTDELWNTIFGSLPWYNDVSEATGIPTGFVILLGLISFIVGSTLIGRMGEKGESMELPSINVGSDSESTNKTDSDGVNKDEEAGLQEEIIEDVGEVQKSLIAPSVIEKDTRSPRVGDEEFVQVLYVPPEAYPDAPVDGYLEKLFETTDVKYDMTIYFESQNQDRARERFKQKSNNEVAEAFQNNHAESQKHVERKQKFDDLHHETDKGTRAMKIATYICIRAESEEKLSESKDKVKEIVRNHPSDQDLTTAIGQQKKGLQSVSPIGRDVLGSGDDSRFKATAMAGSFGAAYASVTKPTEVDPEGIEYGWHKSTMLPLVLDPWGHDSGNAMVMVAEPGGGKSTTGKTLMTRALTQRDDVIGVTIEPMGNWAGVAKAFASTRETENDDEGSEHITVGGDKGINPLEIREIPQRLRKGIAEDADPLADRKEVAVSFLENFFTMRGSGDKFASCRLTCENAINDAYQAAGIKHDDLDTHSKQSPTLRDVRNNHLKDRIDNPEKYAEEDWQQKEIQKASQWLYHEFEVFDIRDGGEGDEDLKGAYANFGEQTEFNIYGNKYVYLDLGQSEGNVSDKAKLTMQILLDQVYEMSKQTEKKVILCMDEFRYFIRDVANIDSVENLFRHHRHQDIAPWIMTQTVHEFLQRPEAETILDMCPYFLGQRYEGLEKQDAQKLGLGPEQYRFIKNQAQPGTADRGYADALLTSGGIGRQIEIHLLQNELLVSEWDRHEPESKLPGVSPGEVVESGDVVDVDVAETENINEELAPEDADVLAGEQEGSSRRAEVLQEGSEEDIDGWGGSDETEENAPVKTTEEGEKVEIVMGGDTNGASGNEASSVDVGDGTAGSPTDENTIQSDSPVSDENHGGVADTSDQRPSLESGQTHQEIRTDDDIEIEVEEVSPNHNIDHEIGLESDITELESIDTPHSDSNGDSNNTQNGNVEMNGENDKKEDESVEETELDVSSSESDLTERALEEKQENQSMADTSSEDKTTEHQKDSDIGADSRSERVVKFVQSSVSSIGRNSGVDESDSNGVGNENALVGMLRSGVGVIKPQSNGSTEEESDIEELEQSTNQEKIDDADGDGDDDIKTQDQTQHTSDTDERDSVEENTFSDTESRGENVGWENDTDEVDSDDRERSESSDESNIEVDAVQDHDSTESDNNVSEIEADGSDDDHGDTKPVEDSNTSEDDSESNLISTRVESLDADSELNTDSGDIKSEDNDISPTEIPSEPTGDNGSDIDQPSKPDIDTTGEESEDNKSEDIEHIVDSFDTSDEVVNVFDNTNVEGDEEDTENSETDEKVRDGRVYTDLTHKSGGSEKSVGESSSSEADDEGTESSTEMQVFSSMFPGSKSSSTSSTSSSETEIGLLPAQHRAKITTGEDGENEDSTDSVASNISPPTAEVESKSTVEGEDPMEIVTGGKSDSEAIPIGYDTTKPDRSPDKSDVSDQNESEKQDQPEETPSLPDVSPIKREYTIVEKPEDTVQHSQQTTGEESESAFDKVKNILSLGSSSEETDIDSGDSEPSVEEIKSEQEQGGIVDKITGLGNFVSGGFNRGESDSEESESTEPIWDEIDEINATEEPPQDGLLSDDESDGESDVDTEIDGVRDEYEIPDINKPNIDVVDALTINQPSIDADDIQIDVDAPVIEPDEAAGEFDAENLGEIVAGEEKLSEADSQEQSHGKDITRGDDAEPDENSDLASLLRGDNDKRISDEDEEFEHTTSDAEIITDEDA